MRTTTKAQNKIVKRKIPGGPYEQMRETVRLIGKGIRDGSLYLPTRNLSAAYASTAPPKDYYMQAEQIYNGFLQNWRYVKDPLSRELLTLSPKASYKLVMGGDGIGVGAGYGAGDCDCATVALGSLFEAAGLPVRLATVSRSASPPGQLMEHVYPEVYITGHGWIAADPVVHPRGGFGDEAEYSRKVIYDLNGSVLDYTGNLSGAREDNMTPEIWERPPYRTFGVNYEDCPGYVGEGNVVVDDFGCLAGDWGCIPGDSLGGLSVEVDEEDIVDGFVETPVLELDPVDYEYLWYLKSPYLGMVALSGDGATYSFDGLSFKKLIKKTKKAFKNLKRKVDKAAGKETKAPASDLTFDEAVQTLIEAGYIPATFKTAPQKLSQREKQKHTSTARELMATTRASTRTVRKPKHVRLPTKVVKPVLKELRGGIKAMAPVAGIVPGMGPAIKLGLEATAASPDRVLAKNMTKMLSSIARINPARVDDFKKMVKDQSDLKKRLVDATKRYQVGRRQLTKAKTELARLKAQVKRGAVPSAQIDLRAADALRMAQGLLQQQASATKRAATQLRPTRATRARRAPVRRVSATRRGSTTRRGVRRA